MQDKIIALYDLKNYKWQIDSGELTYNTSFCLGFFEEVKTSVIFDNLSFGFSFYDENNNVIFEQTLPKSGEVYLETDQKYLIENNFNFTAGSNYKLKVWVNNSNIYTEDFYDFYVEIPPQPYPSWTWNNGVWNSPVPHPQDGLIYQWSEETQNWTVNPQLPTAGTHYFDEETGEWILVPQYELS